MSGAAYCEGSEERKVLAFFSEAGALEQNQNLDTNGCSAWILVQYLRRPGSRRIQNQMRDSILATVAVASTVGVVSAVATVLLLRSWVRSPHDNQHHLINLKLRGDVVNSELSRRRSEQDGLIAKGSASRQAKHTQAVMHAPPRRTDPFDPRPREG